MKKSFIKVYTIYFIAIIVGYMVPVFFQKLMAEKMTKPFTLAFSNTPGVLRKVNYKDVTTTGMFSSFICAGRVPISIAILSYAEKIQFSVTMDTCVNEKPQELRDRFQKALDEFIELA